MTVVVVGREREVVAIHCPKYDSDGQYGVQVLYKCEQRNRCIQGTHWTKRWMIRTQSMYEWSCLVQQQVLMDDDIDNGCW
jgi:hypothetical protein